MTKILNYLLISYCFFLFSCNNGTQVQSTTSTDTATIDGHPAWAEQGNIYEVNVRQYTPEGTFKAFENNLDRLKDMGVQTLWFMPINPISQQDRKGKLGSYYAVSDYTAINPEFGTMDDWKALVKDAHGKGFKVIIDWVPNHTGADHSWITSHPDFYIKDSSGKPAVAFDWSDVRQLDYKNSEMQDSMIAAMKYWITNSDVDGFRCDVAWNVPGEFWKKCTAQLKQTKKNLFFLAEGEKPYLVQNGFDAFYPWEAFHMMIKIAKGQRPAFALDSVRNKYDTTYFPQALALYFTSNHDENSWNKADYGTMPGPSHAPFAVFTQTIDHSVPLIYSGQEEPFLDSISFFYKDTITFSKFGRANFYKTLLNLRRNNPALAANASFRKLSTNNDAALYAFERQRDGNKILVILNLSNQAQQVLWKTQPSEKEWNNVFAGKQESVDKGFAIAPWGYTVYERRQ